MYVCVTSIAIPTTYIVVSLIKRQEGTEERTLVAPKFKCSDEKRARKVREPNLPNFIV